MNKLTNVKKGKKEGKNTEMLLDSNPHLLSARKSLLSIRPPRNCDYFFIKISNSTTI